MRRGCQDSSQEPVTVEEERGSREGVTWGLEGDVGLRVSSGECGFVRGGQTDRQTEALGWRELSVFAQEKQPEE